jgi:hypothetical protein
MNYKTIKDILVHYDRNVLSKEIEDADKRQRMMSGLEATLTELLMPISSPVFDTLQQPIDYQAILKRTDSESLSHTLRGFYEIKRYGRIATYIRSMIGVRESSCADQIEWYNGPNNEGWEELRALLRVESCDPDEVKIFYDHLVSRGWRFDKQFIVTAAGLFTESSMEIKIEDLEWSTRVKNFFNDRKDSNPPWITLRDISKVTMKEMLKYRNFGKKSVNEIRDKLMGLGIELEY